MNQHAQKAAEIIFPHGIGSYCCQTIEENEAAKKRDLDAVAAIIQTHAIEPALEAEKNKWIAEGMRRAAAKIGTEDETNDCSACRRHLKGIEQTILTAAEELLKGTK